MAGVPKTYHRTRRFEGGLWLVLLLVPYLPLVFIRGEFWDGANVLAFVEEGRTAEVFQYFLDYGFPQAGALHLLAAASGDYVLFHRLLYLTAVIAVFVCTTSVLEQVDEGFRGTTAKLCAALAILYPGNYVGFLAMNVPYIIWYGFFVAGVWLALAAAQCPLSRKRGALFLAAALAILYSLSMNSLAAWVPLLGIILYAKNNSQPTIGRTPRATGAIAFLALPFVYFGSQLLLFPRSELYAAYNQPSFNVGSVLEAAALFVENGIWNPLNSALGIIFQRPLLLIASCMLLLGCVPFKRHNSEAAENTSDIRRPDSSVFRFAIVGLFLAAAPYIAVGKAPSRDSIWESRHTILLGLPLACSMVAALDEIGLRRRLLQSAKLPLLALLLMSFWLAQLSNSLEWVARWNKDEAIVSALASRPEWGNYSVYWVKDETDTIGANRGPTELAGLLSRSWGGEKRVAFNWDQNAVAFASQWIPHKTGERALARWYRISEFHYDGREAALRVAPGANFEDGGWRLGLRSLAYQLLRPHRLQAFRRNLVRLELSPTAPRVSLPDPPK